MKLFSDCKGDSFSTQETRLNMVSDVIPEFCDFWIWMERPEEIGHEIIIQNKKTTNPQKKWVLGIIFLRKIWVPVNLGISQITLEDWE